MDDEPAQTNHPRPRTLIADPRRLRSSRAVRARAACANGTPAVAIGGGRKAVIAILDMRIIAERIANRGRPVKGREVGAQLLVALIVVA